MPATVRTPPASRSLGGGAVLIASTRVAAAGAGTLTTILLARLLGPAGWGRFYVAQSLVAVLLSASTLGVEHGIAYFVGAKRWESRSAFGAAMKVATGTGMIGAVAAVAIRLAAPSAFAGLSPWLTAIAALGLPFALASLYASYIALATSAYEAAVAINTSQALLVLCLCVPAGVAFDLDGAVVGLTVASAVAASGAFLWGMRRLPISVVSSGGGLRRAVAFGVKGWAANALQLINYRIDLFILATVASAASVGSYSVAVAITSTLWILPRALSDVLFPRVAALSRSADDNTTLNLVEEKSVRHASGVVLVTGAVLAVGLEFVVVRVLGDSYRPVVRLGLILIPGACAIGIASVLAANVVGRGLPQYSLYGALISTPVTIVLYIVLIPRFGATGAAAGSTASYVFGLGVVCWFFQRATQRSAIPLLVPTRSEAADVVQLFGSFAARLRGRDT